MLWNRTMSLKIDNHIKMWYHVLAHGYAKWSPVLKWPSISQNLNIVEDIGKMIFNRVYIGPQFDNKQKLTDKVIDAIDGYFSLPPFTGNKNYAPYFINNYLLGNHWWGNQSHVCLCFKGHKFLGNIPERTVRHANDAGPIILILTINSFTNNYYMKVYNNNCN